MSVVISNADILTPKGILKESSLFVKKGKIGWIGKDHPAKLKGSKVIYARGFFASPGFIDLQIYGDPKAVSGPEAMFGTTGFLAAIPCLSPKATLKRIDSTVSDIGEQGAGARILGINLEGPYINRMKSGAQDKKAARRPDAAELKSIIKRSRGSLRLMTIAPEVDGAMETVEFLKVNGVMPSIGHTRATFEEAEEAADRGASCATHVFNGMEEFHHRQHRAIEAIFKDPRISATVILDGEHISPAAFQLLLKCKGREKVILITDSLRAETSFDAKWDGRVYRLKDGTIAGSGLTMIGAVKNAVKFSGISLSEAVSMASGNPARLLGFKHKGEIKVGNDADIVLFDNKYDVWLTMVEGRIVYKKCAA